MSKSRVKWTISGVVACGSILLICVLLGCIAWFEYRRFQHVGTMAEAVLALLLIFLPLACVIMFERVERTGRPATANLFLAMAMFSGLLCLAIAELRDPISRSLSSPLQRSPATLPSSAHPAEPVRPAPTTSGEDDKPVSYSLYDMLSLIGMVATISVIVLGAMVTEETRKLERVGDQRRATMLALAKLNGEMHRYYQDLRSGRQIQMSALGVHVTAAEVELTIGDSSLLAELRVRLAQAFDHLKVTIAIAGDAVRGSDMPKPQALVDEIVALAEIVERHYRRISALR